MAFAHVDHLMAPTFGKAQADSFSLPLRMKRGAAAAAWRRQMRLFYRRFQSVLAQCARHPIAQEAAITLLIQMLQLAPSAFREVTAWRCHMVRPPRNIAVRGDTVPRGGERYMPAVAGDTVAACRHEPDAFAVVA
ncbi:hypothetical protein [Stakelama saccharophila]|uniref:Uncharacterized protein n=1 Tax=Stakelama saccharophila TaxID=3075605 RepID=A0ABZ0B6H3_9SPHN|nr:hypothetical protein [Stakelama sp. W311]WNO52478.1 hypothetical protein RPR59_08290 [Stakelama sp. W311]